MRNPAETLQPSRLNREVRADDKALTAQKLGTVIIEAEPMMVAKYLARIRAKGDMSADGGYKLGSAFDLLQKLQTLREDTTKGDTPAIIEEVREKSGKPSSLAHPLRKSIPRSERIDLPSLTEGIVPKGNTGYLKTLLSILHSTRCIDLMPMLKQHGDGFALNYSTGKLPAITDFGRQVLACVVEETGPLILAGRALPAQFKLEAAAKGK